MFFLFWESFIFLKFCHNEYGNYVRLKFVSDIWYIWKRKKEVLIINNIL
ncbi:hypothetical protein C8P67_10256 [Flavobacterium aquicola]|uniref:Uncharacterized protein n=1 Tax=Flavobacterium aquicola TaxID=1682742 RepID=A0A3E0ERK0_9FLAO|nr:hypothetical protein C8P67_10256 [Flavobacterium aquicola]